MDIVGAAHVAAGSARDAVDGVVPAVVVCPGSVPEVRACVRTAAARGAALVASGLGAYLDRGVPPRRLDVLLRLERLAAVIDHQAEDMTVTVEAGCPLPVLAERLAARGQWLPLDPPAAETTTVGGLIAANLSGPLRASQGTVRDLLLGLRVVGADGALVACGGRVVKNVAGYDLPKLHVGALGSVGVIVEATFKVRPRPACEAAVVIPCGGVGAAAETALAVLGADLASWLEVAGPALLSEGAAVAVGLAGIAEEVAAARERVLALARARHHEADQVEDGSALRARLGRFPVEPAAAVLRAATLPTEVGRVMEAMLAAGAARVLAHAANGVVRAAFAETAPVRGAVADLRPGLEASGGALIVERAAADVKTGLEVWGDPGSGRALMQGVKKAFDPAGLLAPGRFVAGL